MSYALEGTIKHTRYPDKEDLLRPDLEINYLYVSEKLWSRNTNPFKEDS